MRSRRLVAVILAFSVLFCFVFSAGATEQPEQNNAYVFADGSIWDFMLFGGINGFLDEPYSDFVQDIAALACEEVCPDSEDGFHHAYRYNLDGVDVGFHEGAGRYGVATCHYCGYQFKLYSSDLAAAERGFVDGLDSTIAHTGIDFADISLSRDIVSAKSAGTSMVLSSMGGNTATFVGAANTDVPEEIKFVLPEFTWLYLTGEYTLDFSCYPWDFSNYRTSSGMSISYSLYIYHKTSAGLEVVSKLNSYHSIPDDTESLTFKSYRLFPKFIQGDTYYIGFVLRPGPNYHYMDYCEFVINSVVVEDVFVGLGFTQPSGVDASSRTSSLMQTIHNYNTNNSYVDDSTNVNFFIVPSGDEPSADTAISLSIYDEETLVYTDPVTGTEYLTNGWTYDYLTRCYTLDMADGFTIGDAAIDTIKLTYGDELLTVDHYSGGSLIQSDKYNYVMMSGSACSLNGHSYTYEETKTPTCTSTGERKYTCTVCGDSYAENIPMNAHAYTHSVLKEPTCTDPGIYVYTCSTCENQVTESVEALGHDWQETSSTATTYALPEGTSCPDCAGADFAVVLDEEAGTYSCTCNGCGTIWTVSAVITYGATTYTCTRCGTTKTETDDPESGLFNSIGNLIADGITWATDKMKELVENLSGLTDIFNDYVDSVKENTGQFPAFLGAVIGCLPEDFMTVIWFGVVALVVLAVWIIWFK